MTENANLLQLQLSCGNKRSMAKRGAYHRRTTEVKVHYANERKDHHQHFESGEVRKEWVSLAGKQQEPKPNLINIVIIPPPEQVRREMVIAITRGSIQLDPKFQAKIITADAIARGVLKQNEQQ